MPLIVILNEVHMRSLLDFFTERPRLLNHEHIEHTRSPLDNLEHYMWEELREDNHLNIRRNYERNNNILTDAMLIEWMNQELVEHNFMND